MNPHFVNKEASRFKPLSDPSVCAPLQYRTGVCHEPHHGRLSKPRSKS